MTLLVYAHNLINNLYNKTKSSRMITFPVFSYNLSPLVLFLCFSKKIFVDKMAFINHVEIYSYQLDQKVYVNFTYLFKEERMFRILSSILSRHWR